MDTRPIFIVGSGLMGSLLAHRLRETHPSLQVKLLDTNPGVQIFPSWSFRNCEISAASMNWLKPFISCEWKEHQVAFQEKERTFSSGYSIILSGQFQAKIKRSLGSDFIRHNGDLDDILREASFVIDTRMPAHERVKCSRVSCGTMVELRSPHHLKTPIIMDVRVKQRDLFRFLQFLPIDDHHLLIQDVRYCQKQSQRLTLEDDLIWEIRKRWEVKEVLHHETSIIPIPAGTKMPWCRGRLLDLSGVVNLISGEELPDTVRLIDQLVSTSMRPGELKEVIKRFHTEKSERFFSRLLRKMLYHSSHPEQRAQILHYLFKLPEPTLEKFLSGNISLFDLGKALLGNPPLPLMRAMPWSFKNV